MEKEKGNSKKQNGGLNTSQKDSPAEKQPITGNSEHEQSPAKQNTSDHGKKPKQTSLPLPTITDPVLIADLFQDNIAMMRNAGFFVWITEGRYSGLPVINMMIAAPEGYKVGRNKKGRVFVCEAE